MLDLIIIGGGPIGIAIALEAKRNHLNYLVLEKGPLVNSLYHYPANMHFFSSSEKLEIGGVPFISIKSKPSKAEALEYYRRIATSNELTINLFEEVKKVDKMEVGYRVITTKSDYKAKNIVIATGFYDIPNKMNVSGEDLPKVFHYYDNPHYFSGQKVAVIGASNSSVDAALEVYRKGGEVTMIVRREAIGERVKYWVKPDIENRIKEGSIKALFNANVTEIRADEIDVKLENGESITLANDFVLALTGYLPNFDFLEKIGVNLSKDKNRRPEYNAETMETNQKGLYLAGVICGGTETHLWFIENSRIHAELIVNHILESISYE